MNARAGIMADGEGGLDRRAFSAALAATVISYFIRRRRAMAATSDDGAHPVAAAPETAESSYRLGRAAKQSSERLRYFREGMARAQAGLAGHAEAPEGLYWLAVNTGAEALERGRFQALPALPEMERLLLRCHAVAPSYEHAGPARVLGRLYHKAPSVISIGSTKKARQWLEIALATAPDYPGNLAFAADFLSNQGDPQRAKELAQRCLSLLSGRDYGPDADEWRAVASEVLEESR
jgi:tetratricopeptide (TPR) repeat protein